jgi:hypothetical protein
MTRTFEQKNHRVPTVIARGPTRIAIRLPSGTRMLRTSGTAA